MLGYALPRNPASRSMSLEILYITPVIPTLTGNGLAMRAGMVLEALASRHSVSL